MSRIRIHTLVGFVLLVALWAVVTARYGQFEAFRIGGVLMLLVAAAFAIRPKVFVRVGGGRLVGALTGWPRFLVVFVLVCLGLLILVFPEQVACSTDVFGYQCT